MPRTFHGRIEFEMTVPDDVEPVRAANGDCVALKLADGSTVKPWVVFEHDRNDGSDPTDLKHEELNALGVEYDYDERELIEAI